MTGNRILTRRQLLQNASLGGAAVAATVLYPSALSAFTGGHFVHERANRAPISKLDPVTIIDGTDVRALANRALEVATAAGAQYADVRLTRQLRQVVEGTFYAEHELIGVGVRAVVNGYQGFAASPYWNGEEMATLAREAVRQAQLNARSAQPLAPWTPIPVASGSWSTPTRFDPFVVSLEEKEDLLQAWSTSRLYRGALVGCSAIFSREEQALATTDGTYVTQTLYQSGGEFALGLTNGRKDFLTGGSQANGLEYSAAGWELFLDADLSGQLPRMYDEAVASMRGGPTPKVGDIGRYDVVLDAATTAGLLGGTIGTATQLDRALGYEANAGGTSYLGPNPSAFLGAAPIAAPLISISANRSMPQGLATVQWDDEGVVPEPFTLVKNGVLRDYQTTRAQAHWLAPWYQQQGLAIRSHGCAASGSAMTITMQHTPNLVLEPGNESIGFNDLIANTKRGLALINCKTSTDFQQRTGTVRAKEGGCIYEIVNGRLGQPVFGLGMIFEATEFWKKVVAIGGADSAARQGLVGTKGEPAQGRWYSAQAVPMKATQVAFVDVMKRA